MFPSASDSSATPIIFEMDLNTSAGEGLGFAFRSSIEVARRRRANSDASTISSADGSSTVNSSLPELTAESLPFRDSLEIARGHIAGRRERQARAPSAAPPTNLRGANATTATFGEILVRQHGDANPWAHRVAHRNSLDLPRERATRDVVAKRRARTLEFKHRARAHLKGMANRVGAAITSSVYKCFHGGYMPERDIRVNGRPIMAIVSTAHKMLPRDYDAWEYGQTRLEHLEERARADGFSDVAAWCRREGIRH